MTDGVYLRGRIETLKGQSPVLKGHSNVVTETLKGLYDRIAHSLPRVDTTNRLWLSAVGVAETFTYKLKI